MPVRWKIAQPDARGRGRPPPIAGAAGTERRHAAFLPGSRSRRRYSRVRDLDGREISTASLRGKVVIVNFWATWCGPCRAEIPDLVALQDKYRDTLQVIGISEDEAGVEVVRRFAAEHQVNSRW